MPYKVRPGTHILERQPIRPESAVVTAFREARIPLNNELVPKLNGDVLFDGYMSDSGFTNATLYLADVLNSVFPKKYLFDFFAFHENKELYSGENIRKIIAKLERYEDKLVARFILDFVEPCESNENDVELKFFPRNICVGTCPAAERYFLEFVTDKGYSERGGNKSCVNVIVDKNGRPIIFEKQGKLGDPFSCLTLEELVLNSVRVPAGSLLAVKYDKANIHSRPACDETKDSLVIPVDQCDGFRMLRFSTLAVPPEIRKRAFGNHIEVQRKYGFPGYDTVTLDDFRQRALHMVG